MEHDFTKPADSLDAVPEQFRPLYAQGQDGKFIVNEAFNGVVGAVTGLNTSLKAARLEAKNKTAVDLTPLAEFGADPAAIKTAIDAKLQELQEAATKGGGDAKANLEKIKGDLAKGHSDAMTVVNAKVEAYKGQLYGLLVENSATAAVAEAKGVPELLLPFIKQQVKVVEENGEFKVYVVDGAGDQRYSGVTGSPMTIKELVAEMKANAKYGRLFESEQQLGGGGKKPGVNTPPRQQGKELSSVDKINAGLAARNRR